MNAQRLVEQVVHRVAELVTHGTQAPPRTDRHPAEDRYEAPSGSSWTVEELTTLARESMVDEPED
jgi:hypothetical protein